MLWLKKIKSSKKGDHHSSAWKVAFADFAVAMMAFFLLLWLLNSTNAQEKQELSKYFKDPSKYLKLLHVPLENSPNNIYDNMPLENKESFMPEEKSMLSDQELKERQKMMELKQRFIAYIARVSMLRKYKDHIYLRYH